jgi:hypothetical protein
MQRFLLCYSNHQKYGQSSGRKTAQNFVTALGNTSVFYPSGALRLRSVPTLKGHSRPCGAPVVLNAFASPPFCPYFCILL